MTIIFDNSPKYISNSQFKVAGKSGTGNSTCPVPKTEQVRLQNHLIDEAVVTDFLNLLYDMGEDKISIELSHRRTTQRWGTAWPLKRRVVLYRHTAWCLIHEIGHIINDGDARAEADKANAPYFQYRRKSHGRQFGKYQQMLYDLWMENIEPRWEHLLKAALDAPAPPKVDPVKSKFVRAFMAGKFGSMVSACADPKGKGNDVYVDGNGRIEDYQAWLDKLVVEKPVTLVEKPVTPFQRPHIPQRKRYDVQGGDVQVGDKVWFYGNKRKSFKITGIVKRVNLKTCRITGTEDGTDWRVSPRLLHKEI